MTRNLKKAIPLVIILLIIVSFYALGFDSYFTFSMLQEKHLLLKHWVSENYGVALVGYALVYILIAAASLPVATFLTLVGGYLFGPLMGLIVVDISATLGATLFFLSIKYSLGDWFQGKGTSWVTAMEKGFRKNAFSYLLFLRLVPLFPFWAVTLVSGILRIPLNTFFTATLVGIIPGAFIYTLVGNGLGVLLEKGEEPNLGLILSPEIFWPIVGLAFLSLVPILYKRIKGRHEKTKG